MFNEMKMRVAKLKSNVNTNSKSLEFYFQNGNKVKKEIDNKENVLENIESEEDRDLILEECEEKEGSDDEEVVEEKNDSDRTKVN